MLLEKELEKKVCEKARKLGFLAYKMYAFGQRGLPDRIFIRSGEVFFVEFKRNKDSKLRSLQQHIIKNIRAQGIKVYVIYNLESAKKVFGW